MYEQTNLLARVATTTGFTFEAGAMLSERGALERQSSSGCQGAINLAGDQKRLFSPTTAMQPNLSGIGVLKLSSASRVASVKVLSERQGSVRAADCAAV